MTPVDLDKLDDKEKVAYVGMLMSRVAYLNQLRVGSISVFLVITTIAMSAISKSDKPESSAISKPDKPESIDRVLFTVVLLCVGASVYFFNLWCRARASAAAQYLRTLMKSKSSESQSNMPNRWNLYRICSSVVAFLRRYQIFDEDASFSLILMAIIALLGTILWSPPFGWSILIWSVFGCGQYLLYWYCWRHLAKNMDQLPV